MIKTLFCCWQVGYNVIIVNDSLVSAIRVHTKYVISESLISCPRGPKRIENDFILRINLLLNI